MVTQDRQFPLSTPLSTLLTLLFIWLYTAGVSLPPSPLYTSSKDLMSDMCQVSVFRPWLVGENSAKTHSKSGERYKYIQSSDVIDIINISKIENIKENSFQGFKVLQTCPLVLKFLKT